MVDKVADQRKIRQSRICPTVIRRERKGKLLKGEQCREKGMRQIYLRVLGRQVAEREQVDTGEDRTRQEMRRSPKITTYCQSHLEVSKAMQERQRGRGRLLGHDLFLQE